MRARGLFLLMLVTGVHVSNGARILGLFPLPGKSHMRVNSALVKELANRGHEVTVVSPYPENNTILNYKDIALDVNEFEKLFSDTSKQQVCFLYSFLY
jgi:glucuronosyltransferase